METITNTTIYKCEHCRKTYQKKYFCEAHEFKCAKNPINFIKCSDCKYFTPKELEYYVGHYFYSEEYVKINAYWCESKKHWLHPKHKCNDPISSDNIIDEVDNLPMPNECGEYEYENKYE